MNARNISVSALLGKAAEDIETNRLNGKPMTASYSLEHEGIQWVLTVNPGIEINQIIDARQSFQ